MREVDEQYTRQLEILLRVIQTWTADSACIVCQTIHDKCLEALKK